MKATQYLAILTIGLLLLTGCNQPPKIDDKDLQRIEYPALLEMLNNPKPKHRTILIDVRSKDKYVQGHIPKALNIPIQDLVWQDPRLMEAKNLVVYAGGWTDYRSPAAAKKLLALGYKNVFDFRGGIETWQAYGDRLETGR